VIGTLADGMKVRARDYLQLTKARLSLTVVLSGVVGYWLGASTIDPSHLLWFVAGTFLVVAAANAFNQGLERSPTRECAAPPSVRFRWDASPPQRRPPPRG
jgi:heme O synthase-like polyprenyltransferase